MSGSWVPGSGLRPDRGWFDIRVVGPALMVVFGLVLIATPPASVGVNGAVGNAGTNDKLPVEDDSGDTGQQPPPGSVPTVPTVPDAELEPEPDIEPAPAPEPIDGAPEPAPAPENPVLEPEGSGVLDSELEGATGPVGGGSLPRTGADDGLGSMALVGGSLLLLGGGALLVAGRRSESSS